MTVLILAIIFTTQNLGLSSRITNQQWRLFINPLSLFYCNFTANDVGITYPNSSSDKGARSNSFNWARFDFIFITALGEVFLAYDSIIIREKKKTEDPYTLRPVPRVLDCLYQKQKKKHLIYQDTLASGIPTGTPLTRCYFTSSSSDPGSIII